MPIDVLVLLLHEHWVQLLSGFLIPLLVGWSTKLEAHPAIKALVNFLISLAVGVVEAVAANGGAVDIEQIVTYVLSLWGISHLSYKMVWQPAGGGRGDPVRMATPNFGLSGPVSPNQV